MRIAIGSTNPIKCNATRAVVKPLYPDAEFVSIDVPSGVSAQPWGNRETRSGALNRARAAQQQTAADLGVGLEGGVQDSEFGLMTAAWCVIVDPHGRIGVGGNSSVLLPPAVSEQLRQQYELGTVMDQFVKRQNTRHQNGAIGILTDDLETRQSAYEHIIRLALASFRHPEWYPTS
ncbi:MAG: inosine/xanthosine triphosphatase [Anaerolineae bacterium]|nr:inosine/xanthosine triphosphatase [Anaerolineae bacterium]